MNRRQFIIMAQVLGLSAWFGDMAFAQVTGIRTRKSAITSAAATDIDTLRKGVSILTSNNIATQYKSWMYWANSHGTPNTIPPEMTKVWSQCHHGTPHFLSWHRAYLFFFESLIRDITQQENFALPYWDWYDSNNMPKVFGEATNSGKKNPLFHTERGYKARTLLRDALRQPTFEDFQDSLEGNPHGTVHVMVGGEMGYVDTSARDPIFWAHHCNIDRMWNVWLALDGARKNPVDANWLKQRFAFDVEGNKALLVNDLTNTDSLGYRYDSIEITGPTDPTPPRPENNVIVQSVPNPKPSKFAPQTLAAKSRIILTGESINLQLLVPQANKDMISTMAIAPQAREAKLSVVLEGVKATELGLKRGFEYRVYVNLPKQKNIQNQHQDFYLGVINSFQLGGNTKDGKSILFKVSPLAESQAKNAAWSSSDVNLSLLSDDNEEEQPLVEIENVKLILSPDNLK
jgi:tyrosinase